MTLRRFLPGALGVLLLLGPNRAEAQRQQADFAILKADIWTMDAAHPRAEAIAVADGRIIAVGSEREVRRFITRRTRILDAGGRLVLPGFIDAHCHLPSGGRSRTQIDLRGATIETIQARIAEEIAAIPPGQAVYATASYPNVGLYPGLGWPTKEMLDPVSPDNPVVILRSGGHAVWTNSKALEISGITSESEVPYGGEIVLDPATGEPSGILKEAAASLLRVPMPWTARDFIEEAVAYARRVGVTCAGTSANDEQRAIYREMADAGELTLRICGWLGSWEVDECIARGVRHDQGDDLIRTGMLKLFLDGTIGVRTAFLFEDFAEEPGNRGLAQMGEEEFYALVERLHAAGIQVGVHAIGDRAVHWVLNAVERAQQAHGVKGLRHRVEHGTVMLVEDAARFAELGMVASMQPDITGDQEYREQRLGVERAHRVDMWRTLLDNGAHLAWGTDWPVSDLNPMGNLFQLTTRYEEQRLSIEEAVYHYTMGSAWAMFREDDLGSLEMGKLGNMVVLSENIMSGQPWRLFRNRIDYTILGGRVVYDREADEGQGG